MQEEVLLSDEPPAQAPAAPPPAAPGAAGDPLSRAAEAGAGYQDTYASLASQPLQHETPREQQGAAGPTILASSGPEASAAPRPAHRQQGSFTLDSEEIGPAGGDPGFLRANSSAAARGGGPSNGAAPASSLGAGSSRAAPQYHITVSDPVRRIGDSVIPGFTSTHTEYLVASTAVGEGGGGRERRRAEVRRRFKDFVVSVWGRGWGLAGCPMQSTGQVVASQVSGSQGAGPLAAWVCSHRCAPPPCPSVDPSAAALWLAPPCRRWPTCWPLRSAATLSSRGEWPAASPGLCWAPLAALGTSAPRVLVHRPSLLCFPAESTPQQHEHGPHCAAQPIVARSISTVVQPGQQHPGAAVLVAGQGLLRGLARPRPSPARPSAPPTYTQARAFPKAPHPPPHPHTPKRAPPLTPACAPPFQPPPHPPTPPAPPPRSPDKNTLDQQLGKSDFVELRRAELERYLRKLAAHPVVARGEVRRIWGGGGGLPGWSGAGRGCLPGWPRAGRGSWLAGPGQGSVCKRCGGFLAACLPAVMQRGALTCLVKQEGAPRSTLPAAPAPLLSRISGPVALLSGLQAPLACRRLALRRACCTACQPPWAAVAAGPAMSGQPAPPRYLSSPAGAARLPGGGGQPGLQPGLAAAAAHAGHAAGGHRPPAAPAHRCVARRKEGRW